jgi:hypothetical protein
MKTNIIASRKFYGMHNGERLDAVAQLSQHAGNASPHFSVTGETPFSGGCLHTEIVEEFPELAPLVALHLSDDNGAPMHAADNALYHAKTAAVSALARHLRISTADAHTLSAESLMQSVTACEEATAEIRLVIERTKELRRRVDAVIYPGDTWTDGRRENLAALWGEFHDKDAAKTRHRYLSFKPLALYPVNQVEALDDLKREVSEAIELSDKTASRNISAEIARRNVAWMAKQIEPLRAGWKAEAETAREFLDGPDVRHAEYIAAEDNPAELPGFIAAHGLAMWSQTADENPAQPDNHDADHWECTIFSEHHERLMIVIFSKGSAHNGEEPTLVEVLGCLQSDASGTGDSFADFCASFGYDEDSRQAEATFNACKKQTDDLRYVLEDDALADLMNVAPA